MTTKELESRLGEKVPAKVQFVLLAEGILHRVDGTWELYEEHSVLTFDESIDAIKKYGERV